MARDIALQQGQEAGVPAAEAFNKAVVYGLVETGLDLQELAKQDPRAADALAAYKPGGTKAVYAYYQVLKADAEAEEVTSMQRVAAISRHLGSLVRLTDVHLAAQHFGDAVQRDGQDFQTWIDYGDVSLLAGNLAEAGSAFSAALELADLSQDKRSRALAYSRLGDVRLSQGEREEAMRCYQQSLSLAESLADKDPGNAEWQRDLAVSYAKLALMGEVPLVHWQRVVDVFSGLKQDGRLAVVDEPLLATAEAQLALLRGDLA